ncbi:MAG: hypothetical protein MZV49_09180 [Rhodopseudomonas palustris]|nr:hypothetical protein [Rhodopseudomonas palustris]
MLSSPAFKVEEWGNEMVYIQLSENLLDLRSDWDGVRKEADRVKEHLGLDSFFNPLRRVRAENTGFPHLRLSSKEAKHPETAGSWSDKGIASVLWTTESMRMQGNCIRDHL